MLADAHRHTVFGAQKARIPGTFLVHGFATGGWRADRTKHVASFTLTPLTTLHASTTTALAEEGDQLLRFLDEEATQ